MINNQTKIGVISTHNPSYKDSCGVAYFAELVGKEMLNRDMDISYIPISRSYANIDFGKMIGQLIDAATNQDLLIIHFEPGQFGSRKNAFIALKNILDLNKKTIIIFHYLRTVSTHVKKKKWYRKKKKIEKYYQNIESEFNKNVFELLNQKKDNIKVVVFQEFLSQYLKLHGINSIHQPIVCLSDEEVKDFRSRNLREEFVTKYNLDKDNIYIGISGFASRYKGIKELIQAFYFLPHNYHLILNSGLHVDSNTHRHLDAYLKDINETLLFLEEEMKKNSPSSAIATKNSSNENLVPQQFLLNRVHYINHLNDEDFKLVNAALDILVLPYYDYGQNASGPLAQACAISHSGKVLGSCIRPFYEFAKYYPDVFEFVDPGNVLEIYRKIIALSKYEDAKTRERMHKAFDKFTLKNTVDSYIELIEELVR